MTRLPIDDLLPRLLETVIESSSVVIQAPPGAGKTTRVPLALLSLLLFENKKILMLEPRRLAAVNAARWMAASLGEEAGRTVGYTIRFDQKVSAATRIEVVTEGILTRRLQHDPYLAGVGAVIFDEFHERSLNADIALALCLDARQGLREDLRILVMSATMDQGPVAALMGNAPIVTCPGKRFPVDIRYLPTPGDLDVAAAAASAVQTALRQTEGDILVFLPGGGEIRRCKKLLEQAAQGSAPLICPLYGDLPFEEQERAIVPAGKRKVVLATNIAETSLTIEGISVVIDGGFTRQLRFDPGTGLDQLVTVRVSAASAEQRTGRGGRLGPGICYRLWSEHIQRTLVPFSPPEILTADLTALVLELAVWGERDAGSLLWLNPPPTPSLNEGRLLLKRLGALDAAGCITGHGKAMAALPVHPRLAHMILKARERGEEPVACDIAALLSERDILGSSDHRKGSMASDNDIFDRVELLDLWRSSGKAASVSEGADPFACRAVDRAARSLRRGAGGSGEPGNISSAAAACLLAQAYPDRIARCREPGSDRYLLANGRGARLSPRSGVRDREFIVAAVMEGGELAEGQIKLAAALSLDSIRRECALLITRQRMVTWDRGEERVCAREEERLGALVLTSAQVAPMADEVLTALLKRVAEGPTLALLGWSVKPEQFLARARFIGAHVTAGWPNLTESHLADTLPEWLGPWLANVRSLAGLKEIDLLPPLMGLFTRGELRKIEEGAPAQLRVPSGSLVTLRYDGVEPPVMAVKLQELFGLGETPTVAWGRAAVVLHLLSPAGRPVQVTRDLRGFWDSGYREVRRELKGRYPKHPWPEDPWTAVPTKRTKGKGVKRDE